jgi:hypothetical protein
MGAFGAACAGRIDAMAGAPVGSRLVVVAGVAALALVFVLPPLGFVLGIVTLVYAIRLMRRTRPQPQELLTPTGQPVTVKVPQPGRTGAVFGLVLAGTATALGGVLIVLFAVFWTEISDYASCHNDANTRQGEQKCQDALKDAILNRVGQ